MRIEFILFFGVNTSSFWPSIRTVLHKTVGYLRQPEKKWAKKEAMYMHVLICAYNYGLGQSAEGICTMRLAHALAAKGINISVVTSKNVEPSGISNVKIITLPSKHAGSVCLWSKGMRLLSPRRIKYDMYWLANICLCRLPENIDLVYGRAFPIDSNIGAFLLSIRLRVPLFLHFSDPIPSPWQETTSFFQFQTRLIKMIVSKATRVSFTTECAIDYATRHIQTTLKPKSFVLNHVSPGHVFFGPRKDTKIIELLYAGKFYGKRKATALLEGYAIFLKKNPNVFFRFYGTDHGSVMSDAVRLGIQQYVCIAPFTNDIYSRFAAADILVAVDPTDPSLFLSTKLIEYLSVDRKVLLITPHGSPGSCLMGQLNKYGLAVSEEPEAIAAGLDVLSRNEYSMVPYKERFLMMEQFSEERVASTLIKEIKNIVH